MPIALFSLSDKTGLVEFARYLHELGWDFLASGGTARALRDAELPVTDVTDYTGSPEILARRVKTLHPAVSSELLARDTQSDAADLASINARVIDLVACNLYPFHKTIAQANDTLEDAVENIVLAGSPWFGPRQRTSPTSLSSLMYPILTPFLQNSKRMATHRSKRATNTMSPSLPT